MTIFKKVTFTIKGLMPLIMHNGQMADPLNEYAKKLKKISAKRKKTDDDHLAMSDIEWDSSIYHSDSFPRSGIYMPSENIYSALIKASKKLKLGPYISGVMMDASIGYPLECKYKTLKEMKKDKSTWFKKIVSVQTSKIVRTRVIVKDWSINVGVELDPSMLMPEQLEEILLICGKAVGLGDWRPGSPKSPGFYGRFLAQDFKVCDYE